MNLNNTDRKVVAVEMVSLDGVMERPEEWAFSYANEEMNEVNAAGMARSDALLLGRVTYEHLAAYWPNQPAGTPIADHINGVRKFVVSETLETPLRWNNATLIEGGVAEGIAELKRQPGKNITILGSGALVRTLLGYGLLDELRLTVHPLVLGRDALEDRAEDEGTGGRGTGSTFAALADRGPLFTRKAWMQVRLGNRIEDVEVLYVRMTTKGQAAVRAGIEEPRPKVAYRGETKLPVERCASGTGGRWRRLTPAGRGSTKTVAATTAAPAVGHGCACSTTKTTGTASVAW